MVCDRKSCCCTASLNESHLWLRDGVRARACVYLATGSGLGNFPVGTSAALLCELQLVVKSATSKRSRASADTASRQSLEAAASMLPHVALLLFRADGGCPSPLSLLLLLLP